MNTVQDVDCGTMNEPLVSVVIPTLPERKIVLERAILSVKNQTYKNIEIITVTEGRNACEARNIGISKSKGIFIAFLDDDDTWEPTKIEKQVTFLKQHCSVSLVICWIDDCRFSEHYIDKYPECNHKEDILRLMHFSSTSSYCFRKSHMEKIGWFDESLPSAQEYDLAIRCAGLVCCIQEPLVTQYKSINQITTDSKKKVKGLQIIYRKHCSDAPLSVKLKFKFAILMYKLQPYLGKTIEKMVIRYKRGGK